VTLLVPMSTAARFRYTLVAGATAVVIGAGFTVVGLDRHAAGNAWSVRSADVPPAAPPNNPADPASDLGLLPSEEAAPATVSASPSPSASPTTVAPSSRPATVKPRPRRSATTRPATRKPRAPAPVTSGSIIDQVLGHINAARADQGLRALSLDSKLSKASALHNQRMIGGCGLSHQCPGEGGIGDRFSAQGVQWRSAGENIGFGSAGGSDAAVVKAANGLTDSMLAEKPPNDGHRRNLLSTGFTRIGLSVVRDGKGLVWLTQDFVG
jgi:uncharacterized protein YkwD